MTEKILYLNHEGTSTFGDEEGMIISSILSLFEKLLVIIIYLFQIALEIMWLPIQIAVSCWYKMVKENLAPKEFTKVNFPPYNDAKAGVPSVMRMCVCVCVLWYVGEVFK